MDELLKQPVKVSFVTTLNRRPPVPRWPYDPAEACRPRFRSVALYTPSAEPSGMGQHMLELARELVVSADVSLMAWPTAGGRRLLERAASMGVRTLSLARPRDLAFAGQITDFLREHPADVFHIHVGTGRENFDGARAARQAGIPVVIQTQHLPWLMKDPRKRTRLLRALQPVDHLIAVSTAQRKTYERLGLPRDLFTTIPNGIRPRGPGPGRSGARQALNLEADQPVILTVGRLIKAKGQPYLLEAVPELAARFPRLAVVLIGEGSLSDQLLRQIGGLGIEQHVHMPGHRMDARMLLDAADVFVLPSEQEGMPLAVLEAMDAGLPVVATNVVGTSEVVVDGETGTLVTAKNARALASAITELLLDGVLRERYGLAGNRNFLERFTAHCMVRKTVEVYDRALSSI